MEQTEQYKKTVKNTAILGGAQILQMLVTLVRAKIIAVLLGSEGMGVNALIQSALSTVQQTSNFGIFQSSVQTLSQARERGDTKELSIMRKVLNKMALIFGLFGSVICIAGSGLLSELCFGTKDKRWLFIFVSATLVFMALSSSKMVLMQVTRNLTYLAKASIIGSILSLSIAFPIFYFMRMDGIVPAIVGGYFIFYLVNKYFSNKIEIEKVQNPSVREIIERGKPIVKLGFVLMLSSLIMVSLTFALNGIISRVGGLADVGRYQAAVSICLQSLLVINTTLSADYFPRLSAVSKDKEKTNTIVSQQGELITLVVAPISITLILIAPLVVTTLLSSEFKVIIPMLRWMSCALIFRAMWSVLGYAILSKGDKKTYFIYDAVIGHGLNFVGNCVAYYFWGLQGLGISYIIGSLSMVIIIGIVVKVKYGIILDRELMKIIGIFCILSTIAILSVLYLDGIFNYILTIALLSISILFSYRMLNKRIKITDFVKNKLKK